MLLYATLGGVLRAFRKAGIAVIVLKGAALADTVWPNLALRPMADVDLLVKEGDLDRADRTLADLGYLPLRGDRPSEWYLRNHHHLAARRDPRSGLVVEIHRSIHTPNDLFHVDVDDMWVSARPARIADSDTLVLSPEDMLTHLCLHVSAEEPFVGKLRSMADISQVVTFYEGQIDWDRMVKKAIAGNFARYLYFPLYLASHTFGVAVEERTLGRLREATHLGFLEAGLLNAIVRRSILDRDESASVLPGWLLASLCEALLATDGTIARMRALMRTLIHPPSGRGPSRGDVSGPPCVPYAASRIVKCAAKLIRLSRRQPVH